jgi:hypothetical protein
VSFIGRKHIPILRNWRNFTILIVTLHIWTYYRIRLWILSAIATLILHLNTTDIHKNFHVSQWDPIEFFIFLHVFYTLALRTWRWSFRPKHVVQLNCLYKDYLWYIHCCVWRFILCYIYPKHNGMENIREAGKASLCSYCPFIVFDLRYQH